MNRNVFFNLSLLLVLAACTSVEPTPTPPRVEAALNVTGLPPSRTPISAPTDTPLATAVPTQTAVPTTNTPTATPTPAPTVPIWVAAGTAVPQSSAAISPENASQLTELARWGRGVINDVAVSGDGRWVAVATTTGIYIHDAFDLEKTVQFSQMPLGVQGLAFSRDSKMLAAAITGGPIQLLETNSLNTRNYTGLTPVV